MIFISESILYVHISSSELPLPDLHYQVNLCLYGYPDIYFHNKFISIDAFDGNQMQRFLF